MRHDKLLTRLRYANQPPKKRAGQGRVLRSINGTLFDVRTGSHFLGWSEKKRPVDLSSEGSFRLAVWEGASYRCVPNSNNSSQPLQASRWIRRMPIEPCDIRVRGDRDN